MSTRYAMWLMFWGARRPTVGAMNKPAKFLAVLVTAISVAAPAQAATRQPVNGKWQQIISAVPLSYNPFTHAMDFIGASLWTGTFNGITHYRAQGTFDLLTGQGHGTLNETFIGSSSDGGHGCISFVETLTVGPGGVTHIDTRLVHGTGDFTGATGVVTFDGVANTVTGSGTYSGWWSRPSTTSVTP